MKKIISCIAIVAIAFTSCTKEQVIEGENTVKIKFDNHFNNNTLTLGQHSYKNSNNETITINAFDYIVSNFVLVTEDGKEFIYPKNKSYFIISQGGGEKTPVSEVVLEDIPAGRYTKLKFGIGVDEARFIQGESAQQSFWDYANDNYDMVWNWQAGYKFLAFEGKYTTATENKKKAFKIHIASSGAVKGDNGEPYYKEDIYTEISLNIDKIIVSNGITSQVHLKVDANKILDGNNKTKLAEGSRLMGATPKEKRIAANFQEMFVVDHVHNGNTHN